MEISRQSKRGPRLAALKGTSAASATTSLDTTKALAALDALAQETRLAIFRLLIQKGPEGMQVGAIADALQLANATLSFHLKELSNAGLLVAAPNGRAIIYSANLSTMNALVAYLTENCCAGATCDSVVECAPSTCAPRANNTKKTSASTRGTKA
jgi:DNA-binding transcriptional ArsR family regulator